jgi:hypothetical protein
MKKIVHAGCCRQPHSPPPLRPLQGLAPQTHLLHHHTRHPLRPRHYRQIQHGTFFFEKKGKS